jgi:hypothetical protein
MTEPERDLWRLWMRTVFQPANERMVELVLTKADLLDEADMPDCLLQLLAHVAFYRGIIQMWDSGDNRYNFSAFNFPGQPLQTYAQAKFEELKARQQHELGLLARRASNDANVTEGGLRRARGRHG